MVRVLRLKHENARHFSEIRNFVCTMYRILSCYKCNAANDSKSACSFKYFIVVTFVCFRSCTVNHIRMLCDTYASHGEARRLIDIQSLTANCLPIVIDMKTFHVQNSKSRQLEMLFAHAYFEMFWLFNCIHTSWVLRRFSSFQCFRFAER